MRATSVWHGKTELPSSEVADYIAEYRVKSTVLIDPEHASERRNSMKRNELGIIGGSDIPECSGKVLGTLPERTRNILRTNRLARTIRGAEIGRVPTACLTGDDAADNVQAISNTHREISTMNTISHDADSTGRDRTGAPTLRVMAGVVPDHRATWHLGARSVVEQVWTDVEWEALTEAERPGRAQRLPGIGWSVLTLVDEDGLG